MGVMGFIQRSIYNTTITIVVLYGIWIDFVESMKINYEDEYARLGHIYHEEDEIDEAHESRLTEDEKIGAAIGSYAGLGLCAGLSALGAPMWLG